MDDVRSNLHRFSRSSGRWDLSVMASDAIVFVNLREFTLGSD